MLSEYERRQKGAKGGKWLETHIWHAKRYHMVNSYKSKAHENNVRDLEASDKNQTTGKWGYNLAEFSNDKMFRACYRGISQKCILHDLSYLCCIEISGRKCDLEKSLSQITPMSQYSFFSSSEIVSGSREGFAWIYRSESYPRGVVGRVSFMWKPSDQLTENKTLWVWIHPSFYIEVWHLIEKLFRLQQVEHDKIGQSNIKFEDPINEKKLSSKNVPYGKVPLYSSSNYPDSVYVVELKATLNRFRLLGPLSQAVICDSLKTTSFEYSKIIKDANITNNNKSWWSSYYDKEQNEIAKGQWDYYSTTLSSKEPGQMLPGVVLGLTVRDPRKTLPQKKKGIDSLHISSSNVNNASNQSVTSCKLANSPLWDASIRDEVSLTKVPEHTINKMRSEMLTPGVTELPLDDAEARIPVVLVHQAGDKEGRFGDGWDIIIPAGWGMPFWMNFIYRNAKVVGQKELRNIFLESRKFPPLKNTPDSLSGKYDMMQEAEIARTVHFSHPPDKRPNYFKLNSSSPFLQPWNVLVNNWSEKQFTNDVKFDMNDDSFYVLRDNVLLSQIHSYARSICNKSEVKCLPSCDENCLIAVSLKVFGTGTMAANSMISWPSTNDFSNLVSSKSTGIERIEQAKLRPLEPLVMSQEAEIKRKLLKSEHKGDQKCLRKKCKVLKQKILSIKASMDVISPVSEEKLMQMKNIKNLKESLNELKKLRSDRNCNYNSEMRSAWRLDYCEIKNVKSSCSRQLLGYVNDSGISLRYGSKSIGLGYVSQLALMKYLEQYKTTLEQYSTLKDFSKDKGLIVLIRSPDSQHYSYAIMNIYEQ